MDSGSRSNSPWEYIDFEVEVREGNQGEYRVCVLQSPGGEPEEEMINPFGDKPNLKKKVIELEEALYRSGDMRSSRKTRRRGPSSGEPQSVQDLSLHERTVQDFGRDLFDALLGGEVRASYRLSWYQAQQQNKGLRLKLRVQPPELAQLPWEFLYDPAADQYVCLSAKRPLVRYLKVAQPIKPLPVKPPLRVLGLVANPSDQILDELDVEREKELVDTATKELQDRGLVELRWVDGETFDDLQEEMLREDWHAFHFIGHGGLTQSRDEGAIALSDEAGHTRMIGARNLANLLTDQFPLRLVFLNSCEGANSGEGDAFSSAAAILVKQGVPAVVAMQYEITDEAAIAFSRSFYRTIAHGLPVDAAVAVGRASLSNMADHTLEWGTPVLYMRSPSGQVFDVSPEDEKDALQQYREAVELAWVDKGLTRSESEWLGGLAHTLGLDVSTATGIERDVMGSPREELIEPPEPPGVKTLKVPDLTGRRRSEAIGMVYAAGLNFGVQEEVPSSTVPKGEIIGQTPESGTEVGPGTAVSVTISSGSEWEPRPRVQKSQRPVQGPRPKPRPGAPQHGADVPNLVGREVSQARDALAASGLKLGDKNKAPSDTAPEGEVIGQFPVAGTKTQPGSPVRVTVSSGPEQAASSGASGRSKLARSLITFTYVMLALVAFIVLILVYSQF